MDITDHSHQLWHLENGCSAPTPTSWDAASIWITTSSSLPESSRRSFAIPAPSLPKRTGLLYRREFSRRITSRSIPAAGKDTFQSAIGHLGTGVTLQQAQSKLEGFAHALSAQYPRDYPAAAKWTPRLASLQASLAASRSRSILLVTMGAVMLVLLTCCATIANLLLARASVRRKEFSIRAALGRRMDTFRQLAVESFTLSFLGALAGVFLAVQAIPILVEFAPDLFCRTSMDSPFMAMFWGSPFWQQLPQRFCAEWRRPCTSHGPT